MPESPELEQGVHHTGGRHLAPALGEGLPLEQIGVAALAVVPGHGVAPAGVAVVGQPGLVLGPSQSGQLLRGEVEDRQAALDRTVRICIQGGDVVRLGRTGTPGAAERRQLAADHAELAPVRLPVELRQLLPGHRARRARVPASVPLVDQPGGPLPGVRPRGGQGQAEGDQGAHRRALRGSRGAAGLEHRKGGQPDAQLGAQAGLRPRDHDRAADAVPQPLQNGGQPRLGVAGGERQRIEGEPALQHPVVVHQFGGLLGQHRHRGQGGLVAEKLELPAQLGELGAQREGERSAAGDQQPSRPFRTRRVLLYRCRDRQAGEQRGGGRLVQADGVGSDPGVGHQAFAPFVGVPRVVDPGHHAQWAGGGGTGALRERLLDLLHPRPVPAIVGGQ